MFRNLNVLKVLVVTSTLNQVTAGNASSRDLSHLETNDRYVFYGITYTNYAPMQLETSLNDSKQVIYKREVEAEKREEYQNWWPGDMSDLSRPGNWHWTYNLSFNADGTVSKRKDDVQRFLYRLGAMCWGGVSVEEEQDLLRVTSTGRVLGLIINPVSIKGLLWPEGVCIKDISPTPTTIQRATQAARDLVRIPGIYEQIVRDLRLNNTTVNALGHDQTTPINPRLKELLREIRAIRTQVEEE